MNKLKRKLEFVGAKPYWKVSRLRRMKRFLWFTWEDWEYLTLVNAAEWYAFKTGFESYAGPAEVIRDDT